MVARARLGVAVVGVTLVGLSGGCRVLLAIEDRDGCSPSCLDGRTHLTCRGSAAPTAEPCPAETPICTGAGSCVRDTALCASCKDRTTRNLCVDGGPATTEACPPSAPRCTGAGECVVCAEEDRCGVDRLGCFDGAACIGPTAKIYGSRVHSCLRAHDGAVFCWGLNDSGQTGDSSRSPMPLPRRVEGLPPMTDLSLGYYHTCGIDEERHVWCWGGNQAGQIGNGSNFVNQSPFPPTKVVGLEGVTIITAGSAHNCALTAAGQVYCWGYNEFRQCGPLAGSARGVTQPTLNPDVTDVLRLVTTKEHNCAIRNRTPELVCWGDNQYGQLGPTLSQSTFMSALPVPIEVPAAGRALDVATSYEDVCAIFGDRGNVYCWGFNRRGQRGNGTTSEAFDPVPAPVLVQTPLSAGPEVRDAEAIFQTSGSYRCVRVQVTSGYPRRFLCWGGNDRGEVGLGTLETRGENILYASPAYAIPDDAFSVGFADEHACYIAGPKTGPYQVGCYGQDSFLGAFDNPDSNGAHPTPVLVRFPPR